MQINLFNYYSHWIILLSFIYIIGYNLNIEFLKKYVNFYFSLLFINIGFVCLIIYLTFVRNYYIDFTLFILLLWLHLIPLVIINTMNIDNNYNLETFVITLLMYLIYMLYNKKNPITFYLKSNHPKHISDIKYYLQNIFSSN